MPVTDQCRPPLNSPVHVKKNIPHAQVLSREVVTTFASERLLQTFLGPFVKLPRVVQVYESLKKYTLQGSAVGLMPNAQYALEAIHPDLLSRQVAASELPACLFHDVK